MQKAEGLTIVSVQNLFVAPVGLGATDGAVLSGEENAPDAVAGQVKSGEWRVESLREGGALRAQGRRKKEGGRRAGRPLRGREDSGGGAAGSRTSGSFATLFQKVLRHFRRCGILPRHSTKEGRRTGERPSATEEGRRQKGGAPATRAGGVGRGRGWKPHLRK